MLTDLHRHCLQLDDEANLTVTVTAVVIPPAARRFASRLHALPAGLHGGPVVGIRDGERVEVRALLHHAKPWHELHPYDLHPEYVLGAIEALCQLDGRLDWVGYWLTGDTSHLPALMAVRLVTPVRPLITVELLPDTAMFRAYSGMDGEPIEVLSGHAPLDS